jgi:hypothetical protein
MDERVIRGRSAGRPPVGLSATHQTCRAWQRSENVPLKRRRRAYQANRLQQRRASQPAAFRSIGCFANPVSYGSAGAGAGMGGVKGPASRRVGVGARSNPLLGCVANGAQARRAPQGLAAGRMGVFCGWAPRPADAKRRSIASHRSGWWPGRSNYTAADDPAGAGRAGCGLSPDRRRVLIRIGGFSRFGDD